MRASEGPVTVTRPVLPVVVVLMAGEGALRWRRPRVSVQAYTAQCWYVPAAMLPPVHDRPAAQAAFRWAPSRPGSPGFALGAVNLLLLVVVGAGMVGYRALPNLQPGRQAQGDADHRDYGNGRRAHHDARPVRTKR